MPHFASITVRQPQAYDIVDDPVAICGVGTGFEGNFAARVRDGNGTELAIANVTAGGLGIWGNYHVTLALGAVPVTAVGTVEVFEFPPSGMGPELHMVAMPIIFGRALIDPYHGFAQYTVVAGDTLSTIAQHWYGNATQWPRIFVANSDAIADPNLIFPGQIFRIPQ